ncbi:hypothetical protein ACFE04_019215 [Oxalis oulophora]
MMIGGGKVKKTTKKKALISLDEYVDFFISRNHRNLTANLLTQIMQMHDVKPHYKSTKQSLTEQVEKLTLMDPSRSTLKVPISSCASMSLENILNDLNNLNWTETGVVSVHTLNSEIDKTRASPSLSAVLKAEQKIKKMRQTKQINGCDPKSKPKMKKKKTNKLINVTDAHVGRQYHRHNRTSNKSLAIHFVGSECESAKEAALEKAVANQPISAAINPGGFEFQFYSSGTFTGQCGTDLDHDMTAVGYGVADDGTKYWLVRTRGAQRKVSVVKQCRLHTRLHKQSSSIEMTVLPSYVQCNV